jgi:hypothetical protein
MVGGRPNNFQTRQMSRHLVWGSLAKYLKINFVYTENYTIFVFINQ